MSAKHYSSKNTQEKVNQKDDINDILAALTALDPKNFPALDQMVDNYKKTQDEEPNKNQTKKSNSQQINNNNLNNKNVQNNNNNNNKQNLNTNKQNETNLLSKRNINSEKTVTNKKRDIKVQEKHDDTESEDEDAIKIEESDENSDSEDDKKQEKEMLRKYAQRISSANKSKSSAEKKKKSVERQRSDKEKLVSDILVRWWYCMDEWPPLEYDYSSILKKYKLRAVPYSKFANEVEIDNQGLRKVYEVKEIYGYAGVFRDSIGGFYDLRPKEGCPSLANLMTYETATLYLMLHNGLKQQISELEQTNKPTDLSLVKDLKKKMLEVQKRIPKQKKQK